MNICGVQKTRDGLPKKRTGLLGANAPFARSRTAAFALAALGGLVACGGSEPAAQAPAPPPSPPPR